MSIQDVSNEFKENMRAKFNDLTVKNKESYAVNCKVILHHQLKEYDIKIERPFDMRTSMGKVEMLTLITCKRIDSRYVDSNTKTYCSHLSCRHTLLDGTNKKDSLLVILGCYINLMPKPVRQNE